MAKKENDTSYNFLVCRTPFHLIVALFHSHVTKFNNSTKTIKIVSRNQQSCAQKLIFYKTAQVSTTIISPQAQLALKGVF